MLQKQLINLNKVVLILMTDFEILAIQIAKAAGNILQQQSDDGVSNMVKLCRLSSVLQNQIKGPGAGLSGGVQQENLWVDMFLESDHAFSKTVAIGKVTDADYYYDGNPISHKTIGYAGKGNLALTWSKNPSTGLNREDFLATVAIACTASNETKFWRDTPYGYYVIPLDYLNDKIVFSSNNKTDTLISPNQVRLAIQYARTIGSFVPLAYEHDWGVGKKLSHWRAGLAGIQS
jgi:hypothetical protein